MSRGTGTASGAQATTAIMKGQRTNFKPELWEMGGLTVDLVRAYVLVVQGDEGKVLRHIHVQMMALGGQKEHS